MNACPSLRTSALSNCMGSLVPLPISFFSTFYWTLLPSLLYITGTSPAFRKKHHQEAHRISGGHPSQPAAGKRKQWVDRARKVQLWARENSRDGGRTQGFIRIQSWPQMVLCVPWLGHICLVSSPFLGQLKRNQGTESWLP